MLVVISFVLLFAPLFIKFRIFEKENLCANFMSMEYTTVLRAVAILMVMQQHLSGFIFGSRIFTPFGGWSCHFLDNKWVWLNYIYKE